MVGWDVSILFPAVRIMCVQVILVKNSNMVLLDQSSLLEACVLAV